VQRFRGGPVCKAHRLLYHSASGMRGIKKIVPGSRCGCWHPRASPRSGRSWTMCSGSEAGSYLRLIDFCITQLKTQGPARTCNESKEEEEEEVEDCAWVAMRVLAPPCISSNWSLFDCAPTRCPTSASYLRSCEVCKTVIRCVRQS